MRQIIQKQGRELIARLRDEKAFKLASQQRFATIHYKS